MEKELWRLFLLICKIGALKLEFLSSSIDDYQIERKQVVCYFQLLLLSSDICFTENFEIRGNNVVWSY